MPTFDTPEPITMTVELGVGDLRIVASDRTDTVVEVRAGRAPSKADHASERVRVEYANGNLLIKAPKGWRQYTPRGGGESIEVEVGLPSGSQLRGEAGVAALHCSGPLGDCRFQTGVGDIQIELVRGPVDVSTRSGDIGIGRIVGNADVMSGSGAVRIGTIEGSATVKNANGHTWIGDVTGDLHVKSANGSIVVDHAHDGVSAKTANGDVSLHDVARGTVVAHTAFGKVDVGIRGGVAAWLDLDTRFGNMHNELDVMSRPDPGEDSVEVRARTAFGDITVHRSLSGADARAGS
jgi:DUF4097 and DUF4098 domain-containing protein YvlB